MTNEKALNLLADSKISEKPAGEKEEFPLGQRAADAIAKFAGSRAFIFVFAGVLILWMLVNTLLHIGIFSLCPRRYGLPRRGSTAQAHTTQAMPNLNCHPHSNRKEFYPLRQWNTEIHIKSL